MELRRKIRKIRKWCPQPRANLPRRTNYSAQVTVGILSALIISLTFSLMAAQYFLSTPSPHLPVINTATNTPTPTPESTSTPPTSQPTSTVHSSSTSSTTTNSPIPTQNPNPVWHISTVDEKGLSGAYSSIALDSSGSPHISYFNSLNGLKYASWNGTGWNTEIVDKPTGKANTTAENIGAYTSLAVDLNNHPHIVYTNHTNFNKAHSIFNSSLIFGDLKYTWFDGTIWKTQTVDSGHVGDYCSIALDSQGYPHISYYDYNNYNNDFQLKYAAWDGQKWKMENVDALDDPCGTTSIAIDSRDQTHISYYDGKTGNLKYASQTNEAWNIQVVDSQVYIHSYSGAYCSLVLDSNDNPHIGYHKERPNGTGGGILNYASWNQTAWTIQTIDSEPEKAIGGYCSLALDSKEYPHISYYTAGQTGDLKYIQWNGTTWQAITVDSGEEVGYHVGLFTSLALDALDNPHISYLDDYNMNLKYASFN